MPAHKLEIKSFAPETHNDYLRAVNGYLKPWPYSRPLDRDLFDHWLELPSFRPEFLLIAYRSGTPVATLHGDQPEPNFAQVHLVTTREPPVGAQLLQRFESLLASPVTRIHGPNWRTVRYFGGYVLGSEPYHPHWATETTEAFVRSGYRVASSGVILIRDCAIPVDLEACPTGYEIVEVDPEPEYSANAFGFHALHHGEKAAHCYARWYPALRAPDGGTIGQIGNVTTNEGHRRRGLARTMVKMCLERIRSLGASQVLISTGLDNAPALRSYERAGFARRHYIIEWSKDLHRPSLSPATAD